MISEKMAQALNKQLNMEFQAWYSYTAVSSYFELQSLGGFATWFSAQAEEERTHAMKIYRYLLDQDSEPVFSELSSARSNLKSPLEAFELALKNEQDVSKSINNIVATALDEKDFATKTFLDWFVTEQVEEEAIMKESIDRIKLAASDTSALLFLDKEFGSRAIEGHSEGE